MFRKTADTRHRSAEARAEREADYRRRCRARIYRRPGFWL